MTTFLNHKTLMGERNIQAFIDPSATLGEGSMVWHYARVLQEVRIGKNCSIGGGTELGRGTVVGDDSRIGANAFFPPNSSIGERVFVGPGVTCTDDMHPRVHLPGDPPYHAQPPMIEDDAAIGAGAILLPGIRIGRGARVAAGCVVTKDVPDRAMVRGVPSRFRTMPEAWEFRPTDPLVPDSVSLDAEITSAYAE